MLVVFAEKNRQGSTATTGSRQVMTSRSMALRSCRTLPGQGKRWQSCSAPAVILASMLSCREVCSVKARQIESGGANIVRASQPAPKKLNLL
jgi:hypothetical protein